MDWLGRTTPEDEQKAAAWREWFAAREPLAYVSLVLGVFSLIEMGALLLPGVAGAVCGVMALRRLRPGRDGTPPARPRGHYLAWAGVATNVLSLVIAVTLVYRWV